MTYSPVPIPTHLPSKLNITLWDFSWYVRRARRAIRGPRPAVEAVERGYNTVRICAMPFLLFRRASTRPARARSARRRVRAGHAVVRRQGIVA